MSKNRLRLKGFVAVLFLSQVFAPVALAEGQVSHSRLFYYQKDPGKTFYISNGKQLFEIGTDELYLGLKEEFKGDAEALKYLENSEHHRHIANSFLIVDFVLLFGGLITALVSVSDISSGIPAGYWVGMGGVIASIPFGLLSVNHSEKSIYNLNRAVNYYNGDRFEENNEKSTHIGFDFGMDPSRGQVVGQVQFSF